MAEYARVRRAHLQTPICDYIHPETGRRISVVAMIHVGRLGYYAGLAAIIAKRETAGAIVHCEGSKQNGSYANLLDDPDLTDAERETLGALRAADALTAQRVPELGWTTQPQAMPAADTWHTNDISVLEVLRRTGTDRVLRMARVTCAQLGWGEGAVVAPNLFRIQTAFALRLIASDSRLIQGLLNRRADPTIRHYRTQVALDGAHATTADVVLVWGATHLPGMDADLRARGYVRTAKDWHTAMRLPSICTALWNILLRRAPRTLLVSTEAAT